MRWRGRKVLVTGAAGVIGRELVRRLAANEADLLSIDVVDGAGLSGRFIRQDLSEEVPAAVTAFAPQIVFHLAATFERTEETPEFWEFNFRHNVMLSHRLLAAVRTLSSLETFLLASSYLIYDPRQYLRQGAVKALRETDPIHPRNLVGVAKFHTETDLEFLAAIDRKFRVVSARIYRVYGCGSRDVISRWVRAGLAGQPIQVFGRDNRFDYVYAGDVAEGLIALAATPQARGLINLGSGVDHSIGEVLDILASEIPGLRVENMDLAATGEASRADMTLCRRLTGWQPCTSLSQGIRTVVAYERSRGSRSD